MDCIKFLKLDFKMTKQYLYGFIIFIILSFFFAFNMTFSFTIGYLFFGIIMLINAPFNCDLGNTGFYEMLPGKAESKVTGRFLYLLSFIVITIFFAMIIIILLHLLRKGTFSEIQMLPFCIQVSFSTIIMCMQYTLNYKMGKFQNQLVSSLIKIIPAFIIFGGSSILEQFFIGDPNKFRNLLVNNYILISVCIILLAVLVFLICLSLSIKIYKKSDY